MSGLRAFEHHAIDAILDRPSADPDDDAAIVARAALRLAFTERADIRPHPGADHEFRTSCLRCGEPGMLNISIITADQRVTISPAAAEPDTASELGRLLAERDRLIGDGVDPSELLIPEPPSAEDGR